LCTAASTYTGCASGYFNSGTAPTITCTSCGTGAVKCTSASVHTSCQNGYSLIGTTTTC